MKKALLPIVLIITGALVIAFLIYTIIQRPSTDTTVTTQPQPATRTEPVMPQRPSPSGADAGNYKFDDGLRNPDSTTSEPLDEFDAGIASREVFNIDINKDGKKDRITRTRVETGTDHFYFEYKIELNSNNRLVDITPKNFRTVEGADCALQKFRFSFAPEFQIVKISRPWQDSWVTPTTADRTVYTLSSEMLRASQPRPVSRVCNVSDLFN